MLVRIIAKDDTWLENMPKTRSLSLACEKIWAEKSVQELWLPKSPTFSSVWMNRYQFAGPLRQSHPAKSISAVWEDLSKHGTLEHSIPLKQISFFLNLHCQPSPPFSLCKLMTAPCESHPAYLTDISSWDERSVRCNLGMCTKQIIPGFDAKLEITISEYSILTQN